MKGMVGIGDYRMEEGEISMIKQLRSRLLNGGEGIQPQRAA